MKLLWKFGYKATRYKTHYIVAIVSTFFLTFLNLAAPKFLSDMTGIVKDGVGKDELDKILGLSLILLGIYLVRVLFNFLMSYFSHKAAWNLVGDVRKNMYDRLQSLSMSFYHNNQTGDLMSRIVNDTNCLELLYAHIIPEFITNIVTVVGVTVILFSINSKLALLTFIPVPIVFAMGFVYTKKILPYFNRDQEVIGELNAMLQDNISGIQVIQSFAKEKEESKKIHGKVNESTMAMLRALRLSGIFNPSVNFLSSAGTVIVVAAGGFLAYKSQVDVEDIVAFLLYLALFYAPVAGLAVLLENAQRAYAGAKRAMLILDSDQTIKEAENAVEMPRPKGEVVFENVTFGYNGGEKVLEKVSFECKPGQMIAFCGPTGVGKTTLSRLVARFYDPDEGRILIDGVDIKNYTLGSLRKNIAPVLQDTFLFNGTIAENIGYAKTDATMAEIEAAAKAAHIHDEIMAMPDGYNTKVGERGLKLSGGQKQRISIARAIVCDAPIIILDEATASVDAETEKKIQEAINSLMGKRTILVIAHRLSTIRNADQIIVLENGKVAERGKHDELINKKGLYHKAHEIQKTGMYI
ncbi:MAG: ABC transporter ATP-binding protein [Eubacteriales bacterium]